MFMRTQEILSVPSGTVGTSSVIDVSSWSNLWLQGMATSMAGTGTFAITSFDAAGVGAGNTSSPYTGSFVTILSLNMAENVLVTASAAINAKWAQFFFTPSSASLHSTGSIPYVISFSDRGSLK